MAIARRDRETFDLSPAGHGDAGDPITVDVTARDPKGHVSTGASDSVTIAGSARHDPAGPAPSSTADAGPPCRSRRWRASTGPRPSSS